MSAKKPTRAKESTSEEEKTIRFLVDPAEPERPDDQQDFPVNTYWEGGKIFRSKIPETKEIPIDELTPKIERSLDAFLTMLNKLHIDESQYQLENVTLTLSVSAQGTVSIISVLSGTAGASAGMNFTLSRKSSSDHQ